MEGAIIRSRKEERRIRVMEQIVFGPMSLEEGCHLPRVSYRQGKRIRKRYMSDGAAGLAHKGLEKRSVNALSAPSKRRF